MDINSLAPKAGDPQMGSKSKNYDFFENGYNDFD
jgi:hypothetical protein